jgi:hypothetical protein
VNDVRVIRLPFFALSLGQSILGFVTLAQICRLLEPRHGQLGVALIGLAECANAIAYVGGRTKRGEVWA